MKNLFIILCTLFISIGYSQTGDPKVDAMLKKMQKKDTNATISYTVNGKKFTDLAMTDQPKKEMYVICSHLIYDDTRENTVVLCIKGKTSGTYKFGYNDGSILTLNGKVYQIYGELTATISGAKASGSFSGDIYLVQGKGKPDAKSSGKISGNFKI